MASNPLSGVLLKLWQLGAAMHGVEPAGTRAATALGKHGLPLSVGAPAPQIMSLPQDSYTDRLLGAPIDEPYPPTPRLGVPGRFEPNSLPERFMDPALVPWRRRLEDYFQSGGAG